MKLKLVWLWVFIASVFRFSSFASALNSKDMNLGEYPKEVCPFRNSSMRTAGRSGDTIPNGHKIQSKAYQNQAQQQQSTL